MAKITKDLSYLQKDALKEISSITTGNATVALSKLIQNNVQVNVSSAELLTLQKLTQQLGGKKRMAMSIYLKITGDISGQVLFLFKRDEAIQLIDLILNKNHKKTSFLDSFSESAFGEMANIFTGSYLNALSHLLRIRILPGIPVVASDYVGPMLEYVWGRVDSPKNKSLCFSTNIVINKKNIGGDFVCIFDESSFNSVLSKLEELYGVKGGNSKKRK